MLSVTQQVGKGSIRTQWFCYQSRYSTTSALKEKKEKKEKEKWRFSYAGEIAL